MEKGKTMSDLISRQEAIDIVSGYAEQFNGFIGSPNDSEVYAYARGLLLSIERNINAVPSAQALEDSIDAVPVVRCKDCKYSDECHKSVRYTRRESPTSMTLGSVPVEYCSRGERKDSDV